MILVGGGSGFFGFNVARCLADRGKEVLLVQRHPIDAPSLLARYWGHEVRQAVGDLLDLPCILGLVKQFKLESIIHAAHMTFGVRHEYGYEPDLHQTVQVQTEGVMNCLEAARIMDLRRVTFVSSVDLYRGWPKQCDVWHEDAYLPPVTFSDIGNKKRAGEGICFLYNARYGVSVASARIGHNYGPGCDWHSVNAMIANALSGTESNFPDIPENMRRHTVYAKDSAEGTCRIHLADSLKHYIYNVSDGDHPTMGEIVRTIGEILPGARLRLGPPKGVEAEYRPVSMERMKEEFGFVPLNIRQGIEAQVAFLKDGLY